jgi:hypothetical protein
MRDFSHEPTTIVGTPFLRMVNDYSPWITLLADSISVESAGLKFGGSCRCGCIRRGVGVSLDIGHVGGSGNIVGGVTISATVRTENAVSAVHGNEATTARESAQPSGLLPTAINTRISSTLS